MQFTRQIVKAFITVIIVIIVALAAPNFFGKDDKINESVFHKEDMHLSIAYSRASAYQYGDTTNVTKVLAKQSGKNGEWVFTIYKIALSFVNIIVVCFLIFVALANILQYDIKNYAIKAVLPKLVGSVIAANLSMTIFVFASKIIDSMMGISIFKPLGWDWFSFIIGGHGWQIGTAGTIGVLIGLLAKIFLGVFGWVSVVIVVIGLLAALLLALFVSLILAFRPYVVLLCVAVAPIAIVCYALPQTSKVFSRWARVAVVWLTLPILANFILRVVMLIPSGTKMTLTLGEFGPVSGIVGFLVPTIVRGAALLFVARLPFKLGDDVSGLISTYGRKLGRGAMVASGQLAYWSDRKQKQKEVEADNRSRGNTRKAYESGSIGEIANFYMEREKEKRAEALKKQADGKTLTRDEYAYTMLTDPDIRASAEQKARSGLAAQVQYTNPSDYNDALVEMQSEQTALQNKIATNKALNEREKILRKQGFHTLSLGDLEKKAKEEVAQRNRETISDEISRRDVAAQKETGTHRALEYVKKSNLYGVMSTIKENLDYDEAERGKTFAKYSWFAEQTRGRYAQGKYMSAVVKEDLADLGTSEEMAEYLKPAFQAFYENVASAMGQTTVTDAVKLEANAMLRRYRTQVKGLKDYMQHPYFDNIKPNTAANIVQGDYALNQQLAREARGRNRPGQDRIIEERKREIFGSGSPTTPEQKRITALEQQNQRRSLLLLQQIARQTTGVTQKQAFARAIELADEMGHGLGVDSIEDLPRSHSELKDVSHENIYMTKVALAARSEEGRRVAALTERISGQEDVDAIMQSHYVLGQAATNPSSVSPELISRAKTVIGQKMNINPSLVDVANSNTLLKAAEAATVSDLAGQRTKITDPIEVQYRIGTQVMRDRAVTDTEAILQDIRTQIASGIQSTDIDLGSIDTQVRALTDPHLQLEFGSAWTGQTVALKEQVIAETSKQLQQAVASADSALVAEAESQVPIMISETFKKIASQPRS